MAVGVVAVGGEDFAKLDKNLVCHLEAAVKITQNIDIH